MHLCEAVTFLLRYEHVLNLDAKATVLIMQESMLSFYLIRNQPHPFGVIPWEHVNLFWHNAKKKEIPNYQGQNLSG